jgi:gas vesicle protein
MNTLIVGTVTGVIAGLLFAPQTGKQTREFFKERFSSFRNAPWEGNT